MRKMYLWILQWLIRQEIINAFVGLFLKKIKSDLDVVLTCLECKCLPMQSSSKGLKVCNDVFVRNSIIWWTGCVARTFHAVFHLCLKELGEESEAKVWWVSVAKITRKASLYFQGTDGSKNLFLSSKIAGQWVDSRVLIY
jgi:hypothetical protein